METKCQKQEGVCQRIFENQSMRRCSISQHFWHKISFWTDVEQMVDNDDDDDDGDVENNDGQPFERLT